VRRIIRKCLEKELERRYQSPADLLVDLHNLKRDLESGTSRAAKASPKNRRRLAVVAALVAFAALGTAGVLLMPSASDPVDSIAVLPFENGTGDPEVEYLSDGISESLINSLSQLPNLKVISRSSSFMYKGKERDLRAIGEELGVDALLLGSLVHRGDELTISAELVDVRDGRQLWGEKYTRRPDDLLAVEQELTKTIAQRLRFELTGAFIASIRTARSRAS